MVLAWRAGIHQIADFPNTYVKLGGLGMKMIGFDFFNNPETPSSQDLEKAWRPYVDTCISAFGPHTLKMRLPPRRPRTLRSSQGGPVRELEPAFIGGSDGESG
jgi:hypothetical protein